MLEETEVNREHKYFKIESAYKSKTLEKRMFSILRK